MSYKFTAKVTNGKFPESEAKMIGHRIKEFDGKFLTIELREFHPTRSNQQNRFVFGVIYPAIKAHLQKFGAVMSIEEIHEFTVARVWCHTQAVVMPDGEVYTKRLSSTKLSKAEWQEFIEVTRAYWAERGLMLPHPNDHIYGGYDDAQ